MKLSSHLILQAGLAARTAILGLLVVFLIAVPVGCDQVSAMNERSRTGQSGSELRVPLKIARAQNGAVLALVPVFIQDQGPFAFALDTGASQSLVDKEIAEKLNLPTVGTISGVTGVTGQTQATKIEVDQWRVGDVQLPSSTIVSLDLPEPDNQAGIAGLLGSDMLSQFGAITVDYENEVLILRERAVKNQ